MRSRSPARTTDATVDMDDLECVLQFIRDAAVVEGPPELYDLVARHWPQYLHKVKPPLERMH